MSSIQSRRDFSRIARSYEQGRRRYPSQVIDRIAQSIKKATPKRRVVLDVGTGTGIAFEQLKSTGLSVLGCDLSEAMIRRAPGPRGLIGKASVGLVESLPFASGSMSAVTAFDSLHWFANKEAMKEVNRVLSRTGIFCSVRKQYVDEMNGSIMSILQQYAGQKDAWPLGCDTRDLLKSCGHEFVEDAMFPCEEVYTERGLVDYAQTVSWWSLVPKDSRPKALAELCELASKASIAGRIVRDVHVSIVMVQKV